MSSETLTAESASTDHPVGHAHPGDKQYVVIALILGLFTAIEVLTYFVDFGDAAIPTLLDLMVVKVAMVVLYCMHLRFDSPVFLRLFVTGLTLAIFVYAIMLAAFQFGR